MLPAHVAAVQEHDISRFEDIRGRSLPQGQVFHIGGSTDEAVVDLHDRSEIQSSSGPGLCHQSDVDLPGLQHLQGMGGGLAFDGDVHMGILFHKAL